MKPSHRSPLGACLVTGERSVLWSRPSSPLSPPLTLVSGGLCLPRNKTSSPKGSSAPPLRSLIWMLHAGEIPSFLLRHQCLPIASLPLPPVPDIWLSNTSRGASRRLWLWVCCCCFSLLCPKHHFCDCVWFAFASGSSFISFSPSSHPLPSPPRTPLAWLVWCPPPLPAKVSLSLCGWL